MTDEHMKTNQPEVYASGDVNGTSMLAHTAYRETEVAVNNMLGIKDRMKYNAIPGVIYTTPEVAGVGETEQSAKEKGLDVTVKSVTMKFAAGMLRRTRAATVLSRLSSTTEKIRLWAYI